MEDLYSTWWTLILRGSIEIHVIQTGTIIIAPGIPAHSVKNKIHSSGCLWFMLENYAFPTRRNITNPYANLGCFQHLPDSVINYIPIRLTST